MNRVSQHQDYLYRSVTGNNAAHPLLSHIDDWEQSSIRKIQEVAEKARNDLARYINDMKSQLKQSLLKLKGELETGREADDYTEIELTDWMEQLEKLRRMFENPPAIEIVDDQAQPLIRVIQRKGFETKKISDTHVASALSKTTSTIVSASFITKEVPTKLDTTANYNKKSGILIQNYSQNNSQKLMFTIVFT
ncbi:unnamed protein product [Rotaria sordida]|uniref:Uncharacterized protein n=1 Tax=Rotaria sordida TaxID=392033 RepID=A0A814LX66_9BILA|nr:unnamed protein product [Rotaria sordida]